MKRISHAAPLGVTEDHRRFCADGLYGKPEHEPFKFYGFGGGYPEIPGLWQQCREQILADWIAARPCTRPHLWWRFDAPDDVRQEHYIPDDPRSIVLREESSAAFLLRHSFLTDTEQRYLDSHPELLEDEHNGK